MLGYEFLPIRQPFARHPCDRRAHCFAAGHARGGEAAVGFRDERYVGNVRRHVLLSGDTKEQRLPGKCLVP